MDTRKRNPLFNFFDVVQVVDIDGGMPDIDRRFGVVLGMSQADDGRWGYAISIYEDEACERRIDGWGLAEENLAATGRQVSRDHIYGGVSIKVSREGEPL